MQVCNVLWRWKCDELTVYCCRAITIQSRAKTACIIWMYSSYLKLFVFFLNVLDIWDLLRWPRGHVRHRGQYRVQDRAAQRKGVWNLSSFMHTLCFSMNSTQGFGHKAWDVPASLRQSWFEAVVHDHYLKKQENSEMSCIVTHAKHPRLDNNKQILHENIQPTLLV